MTMGTFCTCKMEMELVRFQLQDSRGRIYRCAGFFCPFCHEFRNLEVRTIVEVEIDDLPESW